MYRCRRSLNMTNVCGTSLCSLCNYNLPFEVIRDHFPECQRNLDKANYLTLLLRSTVHLDKGYADLFCCCSSPG